jgi:coenzyme F420-reducing hydrogenase delta subunit
MIADIIKFHGLTTLTYKNGVKVLVERATGKSARFIANSLESGFNVVLVIGSKSTGREIFDVDSLVYTDKTSAAAAARAYASEVMALSA